MRKTIYSISVIIFASGCLFLYVSLFTSSLRYENNKTRFNATRDNQNLPTDQVHLKVSQSWFINRFFQNPLEIELYLRAQLFNAKGGNNKDLSGLYDFLLSFRPTWPYFFSGLAQINLVEKKFEFNNIHNAIQYGKHENKVVKSLAEILFYHWDGIDQTNRNALLNYLAKQSDSMIFQVVNISAKFSRVYEYCDFLYDSKHVEYPACKAQYWQPLTDL